MEKDFIRYFELEGILNGRDSNLNDINRQELEHELNKLSTSFYGIFMTVRIKQRLDPSITFQNWMIKEFEEIKEIGELTVNDDFSTKLSQSNGNYSDFWMQNICDSLNSAGLRMKDGSDDGKWSPGKFSNALELIKNHVTYDRGIYNYLNDQGLVNTGRCPITGNSINNQFCYQIFGRKVFISEEGQRIAKQIDRDDHIRTFGKEPQKDVVRFQLRKEIVQKQNGRLFVRILFLAIILMVIYKACF